MSYNLKPLDEHDIDLMVNTAVEIYNNSDPDKYPDFKITNDVELNLLDKIILTDLDESWNEYDAIIPPAFFFRKQKKEKICNMPCIILYHF